MRGTLFGFVLCLAGAACDAPRPTEAAKPPEAPAESAATVPLTASAASVSAPASAVVPEPVASEPVAPEPVAAIKPVPARDVYRDLPPAAAEPPRELVEPPEREPVDFISGPENGVPGGVPGGVVGPSTPQRAPDPNDKSAPAQLVGASSWNCPFPPEADTDGVDEARVTLLVSVSAEGKVLSASVLKDPGHGFGRAARQCALAKSYRPALDAEGKAVDGKTPPIHVRFSR